MEETSLSDFVDEGPNAGEATAEGESDAGPSPGPEAIEQPEGPAVTAAFRPGGATCERCEATVEWLWADGESRVCRGCKDW